MAPSYTPNRKITVESGETFANEGIHREISLQLCHPTKSQVFITFFSNGWIDFWSIPIAALSIHYTYHPMPPFGPPPQADITTPEKEEILLSPMRMPGVRKNPSVLHWSKVSVALVMGLCCDIIYENTRLRWGTRIFRMVTRNSIRLL